MREVKDPKVRQAEIISSAKKLFMQKGFLNVTTQDIVDDLKISRGLLYYHFKSKEDILEHIVETETKAAEHRLRAVTHDPDISVIKKIENFISATIIPSSADTLENRALQESIRLPENTYMIDQLYRKMADVMAGYFAEILIQGNMEGVFQIDNPKEISGFLMTSYLYTLNSRDFQTTDKTVAKHYLSVFNEILNKVLGINVRLL